MDKLVTKLKNKDIIEKMSLEDKVKLSSGASFWSTEEIKKYGIESIFMCDGPHGLRKQEGQGDHLGINNSVPATCFPAACSSSSTWNRDLLRNMGEAIGEEALEYGADIVLGPGVNIKRNPLCGRNFEYFSEDPYIAGKLGASWINGVQSKGIGTSLKHFAANNQENERLSSDSMIDERTLREIYLTPFEIAIKEGNPDTVMSSYNKVNGIFSSDNQYLLKDILRNEWGFEGVIVTDWGGLNNKVEAYKAGLDLEMPSSNKIFDKMVINSVKEGKLSEEYIDESVDRLLTLVKKSLSKRRAEFKYDREKHHELSKEIAVQGAVLLRNEDNILPFSKDKRVALVGSLAENVRYQGAGSSHINPTNLVSIVDGFKNEGIDFEYYPGYEINGDENEEYIKSAIEGAKNCDISVVVIGLPSEYESEGYDRTNMYIPKSHEILVEEIAKVNDNVVVVLLGGSPVDMSWINSTKSILNMYLSGQAVGQACVELLLGKVSPSGKLAETYPIKYEHNYCSHTYGIDPKQVEYREGIYVGYRYYEKANQEVRFPFGFGLSYTTFQYSDIRLSSEKFDNQEKITVSCKIKNTGNMDGAEVVQLYISDKTNKVYRPIKELKGFEKVFLNIGEEKEVEFELDRRSFAYYNTNQKSWNVPSGKYEVLVGASSADIKLSAEIEVESDDDVYQNKDLPKWYINPEGLPSREEFEVLYGKKVGAYTRAKKGEYDLSCTLNDIKDTKAGRMMIEGMKSDMLKNFDGDETNQEFVFLYSIISTTPMQRLVQQSGDAKLLETFKNIVIAANNE